MRPSYEGRGEAPLGNASLNEALWDYFGGQECDASEVSPESPVGLGGRRGSGSKKGAGALGSPGSQREFWPGALPVDEAGKPARRRCRPLGLRVLVVESDAEWRRVLERALEENGFDVKAAGSGKEAMRIACGWSPELLVSEINLPDRDGWELMRVMRSACPRLKGVVLSDRDDPKDMEASREAGFARHLNKQVMPEELIQVLHRVGLS